MKTSPLQTALLAGGAALALLSAHAETPNQVTLPDDKLAAAFASPAPETRPGVYWYWMNNQITKEGITKDLESMSRVGIGRAYIGIIAGSANTEIQALSEPWWELVRFAIREAGRVGVEIGFFNAPGWSQSGGPWVKPEQSMRYATSAELKLQGPQKFSGPLPKPKGMIQEIAVLAYPAPKYDEQKLIEKARTATTVTFESAEPVTVRSVTIHPLKTGDIKADVEVSEDGKTYRKVASFSGMRTRGAVIWGPIPLAPVVASIPPTTGKYFRLTLPGAREMGKIRLSHALRNASVYDKQLAKIWQSFEQAPFDYYIWPSQPAPDEAGLTIPEKGIRNLTSLLKPDGTLDWDVPAGEWIVQRVGMAPTGTKNAPAPVGASGPEVDKINRVPLKHHFDSYIGKLLASMPPEDRKAFKYTVVDSYEVGPQNWTDGFTEVFQKRYGYDPLPWLATLTGRVVESPEKSDRFLWDLRRLVADRMASEYVGGMRDLSHEKGLSLWLENYGLSPAEFLQYAGRTDEVAGEFWVDLTDGYGNVIGPLELRCGSSAAHIYGKKRVWAESYTGGPPFMNTPRDIKALGDWSLSEGVSQSIYSTYFHQPTDKKGPGICAWYGTEINRFNTWWNLAMKPWVDYQRKCTVMLQAGNPVADVAYFIGEDTPKMRGIRDPALPAGYDYDYINAEVIQNRLSVKDGRLVLPEGTSYRVLVLPSVETMRPEVLRKIKALVDAGATVVGPAPKKSPSLENYPGCDQEVEALVNELWGSGKIRVITDMRAVLPCGPDVVVPAGVVWKHRTDGNREIYFIANQDAKARDEKITFRVSGKEPELWWPESGKTEPAPAFKLQGDHVEVPLHLEPLTSVFVVFEKAATGDRVAQSAPTPSTIHEITGPWNVQFEEKTVTFEKLMPWPENKDPEIKYYSGEAVYRKDFDIVGRASLRKEGACGSGAGEQEDTGSLASRRRYAREARSTTQSMLDLGQVNAIARVVLNGKDLGVLWKPPYRVNVSGAIQSGKNALEITVVHTWHNRIVGDMQPGATPTVFISYKNKKTSSDLQPSGLLGPVTLEGMNDAN